MRVIIRSEKGKRKDVEFLDLPFFFHAKAFCNIIIFSFFIPGSWHPGKNHASFPVSQQTSVLFAYTCRIRLYFPLGTQIYVLGIKSVCSGCMKAYLPLFDKAYPPTYLPPPFFQPQPCTLPLCEILKF